MNRHALEVLEFGRVLELVAERATSELGREAVRSLRPRSDREALARELDQVGEMIAFLQEHPDWRPPAVPDARSALKRLALEGGILEPVDLHRVGRLLASSRELDRTLKGRESVPLLVAYRGRLHGDQDREEAIGKTVDAEGQVLDSASRELGRIRKELRSTRSQIVQKLEAYLGTLPDRYRVSDASVSIRDGRYVVPIRREGKSEVGGIVHGESSSGATLFMEPPLAMELMNRVGELERDEEREIRRILKEHSVALRPAREALADSLDVLVTFDSLHARARTALEWEGAVPELVDADEQTLVVVRGRHPLLLAKEEHPVVPFDLTLDPGERALVVSGPNTGGKTVFLKALGIISALTQAGVVPPVGPGTKLPVFQDVFADIGDEQSIAESLSTFSAHLENLREIVEGAGPACLVLIDEMGTGTDPVEGAALATAILGTLVERDALTVASSHLGQLKRLAREGSGIVNASLQFDPDRMEPTYNLTKGRPGRSYGLAIARRLGFPGEVLDRAEEHISSGEASVEELLEELERKEKEAAELVASLEAEQQEARRLREELEEREAELEAAERSAEREARENARQLLMEARQEVEEAIREVKEAAASDAGELEEASRRARKKVEDAARRQRRRKPSVSRGGGTPADVEPGQRVRVAETGARGQVVELRDERALVEVSGLKMEVALTELEPVEGSAPAGKEDRKASQGDGDRGGWTGPRVDASTEVDLRGLRVSEVDLRLSRALDRAVLADLPELRIIHGKGTGALRSRVSELLQDDGRVESFRGGRPGEGGAGVTVVSLS